ncbi:MAG: GntR family transcriptional regulator [Emergencia sp.]
MAKNKQTLSEQIYDDIYEDITHQRLDVGQKLTLKYLSEKYSTSYTPIREALSRLIENGLVTYYSNCGVSVIDFTAEDIHDIYRFTGDLDALAILYCRNIPSVNLLLIELEEIVKKSSHLLSEGKISEWKAYSQDFHKAFYKYAGSECLSDASKRMRPRIELLSVLYYTEDANVEKINQDHINIFQRVRENDFDEAASLMRSHLQYDLHLALKAFEKYKSSLQG